MVYGTSSGGVAVDQDEFGGNPFASSLLEMVREPGTTLRNLPARLKRRTAERTQGLQVPQGRVEPGSPAWRFAEGRSSPRERREALVLMVSDYGLAGIDPLAGAAVDERRVAAMFASQGFSVAQGFAPTRQALLHALRGFAGRSAQADVAALYCTGHGVEHDGRVHLLPADYPFAAGYAPRQLRAHAIAVHAIAAACRSAGINLVFFAGCRTHVA